MAHLLDISDTRPLRTAQIQPLTNILKLTNHKERSINLLVANTATKSPVMVSFRHVHNKISKMSLFPVGFAVFVTTQEWYWVVY